MFTDTPKLQPISSSKNTRKKVPSNQSSGVNNNGSSITASSINTESSKPDTFRNRYNYGSYRGNNYRNQKCPINYDFTLDIQSVYLQEPLQSIDIQWDIAYIGSRWGNIYTYNVATNSLAEKPLCSTESSIISIKASKESIGKILIVSSKGNLLHLRDATSGLLLRTFDIPESINIYSILLNDGTIYCGTQRKEIRKYDFMSGQYLGLMTCGNGAVSMQMYNKYIFVGCYDGYIYILNKSTGKQEGRLTGSGKMILTLEIIEEKIITSAKDNTMKVTDVPSYCLKNNT